MKKSLFFSLLAILAVCGCNVEDKIDTPESLSERKVFTAIIEDNNSGRTKTSLDANGNVLWKQGDQVSIFAGSTINEQYQVTDESDGKTAATLNKVGSSGFVAGTDIDNNVAFYPYTSTASISKNGTSYVISDITLPATQNYAENSFGNGAFPMTAVTTSTTDMNLKFKNVLGGLKLQLKGAATIKSITITGNNNEILCGAAEVTVSNGSVPSISLNDASAKSVTLNCGAGVQLNTETATSFIIALPPMTMSGGFTVVVTDTENKQMEISTTKSQTIARSSLLRMPLVNFEGEPVIDYNLEPFTITSIGSTAVSINLYMGSPDPITLEYKVNSGDWTAYTIESAIELANGESVKFRAGSGGNASFSTNESNNYFIKVIGEGTIETSGNIMSLLDRNLQRTSLSRGAFSYLFNSCTNLVNAANLKLPATTLADYCYYVMFRGCSNLQSGPELPATTLAQFCYCNMFSYCSSLRIAPELPATSLAVQCYTGMFSECTSLTTAPELPAPIMEQACYTGMFRRCKSLTSCPELPSTTLATACYSDMFYGCTSLTTAPVLPATTLEVRCYEEMFYGCTGLATASDLPATKLEEDCYNGMFRGCTKLYSPPMISASSLALRSCQEMFYGCTSLATAPTLHATTLAESCYESMFQGCTSLTTAPALPATTLASRCYYKMFRECTKLTSPPATLPATTLANCYGCYDNMFYGCTSLTTAPELPAATLENLCYEYMFYGCKSLTTAPTLPAATLKLGCYQSMFNGCTSLNYIKMLATDVSASGCLSEWVVGVASTGTFVKNASATWNITGKSGIPSGWTVITE